MNCFRVAVASGIPLLALAIRHKHSNHLHDDPADSTTEQEVAAVLAKLNQAQCDAFSAVIFNDPPVTCAYKTFALHEKVKVLRPVAVPAETTEAESDPEGSAEVAALVRVSGPIEDAIAQAMEQVLFVRFC